MKYIFTLLFCTAFFHFRALAQNDSNAVKAIIAKLSVFQDNDQVDSIWFYENKSMEISKKINYEPGIAHALTSFGVIYRIRGDYPKALENFLKALAIYEKRNDQRAILVEYSGLAAVYYFQADFKRAESYYLKAIELSRKLGSKGVESNNLCNLAGLYNDREQYQEAEKCLTRALKIDQELNNEVGIVHELADLGHLYFSTKDYKKAVSFLEQSLALSEKIEYYDVMPAAYKLLGSTYSDLNKNKESEMYYLKALKVLETVNDMSEKMQVEGHLADLYAKTNDSKKAFEHYKRYIQFKDSMYNEKNTRQLVTAEMNYEFEKKQTAIKFAHDKVVYQLESDNRLHKQWRWFFIVVIALALILLFFAKRAYDNKKRLAALLEAEDYRKDVLLQEVHHRINNNLQIISSLLTLQANNADNEKLSEYLVQSQNRIQSLSALHELLYDTNSPLEINMKDYIDKVLDFHREVLGTLHNHIAITADIEEVKFPTKIAVPLALIINELVTNSIKYAFNGLSEGLIKIVLGKNAADNTWHITISDNGKGLPLETERRKDSLGLKLVTIMTKQIGGTFVSTNKDGAFFSVTFKLTKTK
jgi:two-component sensor histidine kinase